MGLILGLFRWVVYAVFFSVLVCAFVVGLLWGLSFFNLIEWNGPRIDWGSTSGVEERMPEGSLSAPEDPAGSNTSSKYVSCSVVTYNDRWVVVRVEQAVGKTRLLGLDIKEKVESIDIYTAEGEGTLLGVTPSRKSLIAFVHFPDASQQGTLVLYDLLAKKEKGRLAIDGKALDQLSFAENGLRVAVQETSGRFRILGRSELGSASEAVYTLGAEGLPSTLAADIKAAINRLKLEDGRFCRLS